MFVLFLDIDGVVTYRRYERGRGWVDSHEIDPVRVQMVHRIVQVTGARIVLSSTRRLDPRDFAEAVACIGTFFGTTPNLSGSRGDEIAAWLSDFSAQGGTVAGYAIVDDMEPSNFHPSQLPHFFQTTGEDRLTDEITDRIIAHFSQRP